ncbi:MAG: glycosyltransferase [Thermodesulfobacteriota bacterium]|nr:glycosyltransferase [Thermodesulfobacteriota bacterium]
MQLNEKKILMITYYFPPLGGIPPRRSLRFARNLPAFGWKPTVLTVDKPSKREAAWDFDLLNEIEHLPIKIITTRWKDILRIYDLLDKLRLYRCKSWYSIFCRRFPPDPYIGWYPYAVNNGIKAIKQNKINLVYSNSAPFTAHLIGLKLKKKTGLPWVADFRDPWMDDPIRPKALCKFQEELESRQELKVIDTADHIVTACKTYASFLKKKYPQAERKISHVYNGYDWTTGKNDYEKSQNDYLEFVYAGAFYGPQSPITFIKALESMLLKKSIDKSKIRLTIIGGHGDESWKKEFTNSPIMEIVSVLNFIPNNKVRERIMKASCLMLYQAKERGNLIVLGKTFEYISIGQPILALVPKGSECLDILEQSGCLFKQAEPDSEENIEKAILAVYKNWGDGTLKVRPIWDYISAFNGRILTKNFARVLDKIL